MPVLRSPSNSGSLQLEEEFRYLQRKKNVIRELTEIRLKVNFVLAKVSAKIISLAPLPERDVLVGIDKIWRCSGPSNSAHIQSVRGRFLWGKY